MEESSLDFIALIALALSVVNFVYLYRMNRVKLRFEDVLIARTTNLTIFDLVITNCSSLPVSITAVDVLIKGCPEPFKSRRHSFRINIEYWKDIVNDTELSKKVKELPSRLPLKLDPYESRRTFLLFGPQNTLYEALRGDAEHNQNQSESSDSSPEFPFWPPGHQDRPQFLVYTSRRRQKLDVHAEVVDYSLWEKENADSIRIYE